MQKDSGGNNMLREDFDYIYNKYFDNIFKVAFVHTKSHDVSMDIAQDVFIKFLTNGKEFDSEEHKKAWLLTCAHNSTMDYFRSHRYKEISIEEISEEQEYGIKTDETLKLLLTLPEKYKTPLYMYYYEGYKTEEIAKMLKKPASTIRVTLKRARDLLKDKLREEENGI